MGYTLLHVLLAGDVSFALIVFIVVAAQTFLIDAWRASFAAYASTDDEDLEEEEARKLAAEKQAKIDADKAAAEAEFNRLEQLRKK